MLKAVPRTAGHPQPEASCLQPSHLPWPATSTPKPHSAPARSSKASPWPRQEGVRKNRRKPLADAGTVIWLPYLAFVQHVSHSVLDRVSADRNLLTTLVEEVMARPPRLAVSRITLLLNRLSL